MLASGIALAPAQNLKSFRKFTGLTASQWNSVESGKLVAKVVNPHEARELAVLAVAKIHVSRACFVEKFQDIERFKKSPAVLEIGKFSMPPQPSDLDGLTLGAEDAADLRRCKAGACAVKIPPHMLKSLPQEPLGPEPDRFAEMNSLFREALLDYVKAYLAEGEQALIVYQDKRTSVKMADQFRLLLDSWPELKESSPELVKILLQNSTSPAPGRQEFLYWSKEHFGLKPVISITDVIVYEPPEQMQTWIASKQIYASHYFDASLGLTLLADNPADPSGQSIYVAYSNRSLIDLLGGAFAGIRRSIIRGPLKDGLRKNLEETAAKLESSCGS